MKPSRCLASVSRSGVLAFGRGEESGLLALEMKVEAFEAVDRIKEWTSEKMGYKTATKLSCWLVSMMRVAVIKRRMPWSRGTSESSHQRELREERGRPAAGPLKSQPVASWIWGS